MQTLMTRPILYQILALIVLLLISIVIAFIISKVCDYFIKRSIKRLFNIPKSNSRKPVSRLINTHVKKAFQQPNNGFHIGTIISNTNMNDMKKTLPKL